MLLNLAEDVSVEKKMQKRRIVPGLIEVLEWGNQELAVIALTFLKKLSIFKENIAEMVNTLS